MTAHGVSLSVNVITGRKVTQAEWDYIANLLFPRIVRADVNWKLPKEGRQSIGKWDVDWTVQYGSARFNARLWDYTQRPRGDNQAHRITLHVSPVESRHIKVPEFEAMSRLIGPELVRLQGEGLHEVGRRDVGGWRCNWSARTPYDYTAFAILHRPKRQEVGLAA